MRTILASFLFGTACAAAQSQLTDLEKNLAAHPSDANVRTQILNLLVDPNATTGLPNDRVIELRRTHILWLIESAPKGRNWLPGNFLIPPRGQFADPEGYAQSVQKWKEQTAKPNAAPEVIANTAIYLKATDRTGARQMLDAALKLHPDDGMLWRAVGILDAAAMAGLNGIAERGQFSTDAALRETAQAKGARREIDSSQNAFLLGGAAQMLAAGGIQNQGQLAFGEDDPPLLAERWLRRAIQIAPSSEQWKNMLAPIVRGEANRAEDPRERARLFSEAMALAADRDKPSYLADAAKAEFEAGDDQAAARDAQKAIDAAADLVKKNPNQAADFINRGNSVLGRIALARGDAQEARARLRAAMNIPADANNFRANGPDMSLAQDMAEAGERDAVIAYLEASRQIWLYDRGLIDHYIRSLKAGKKREAFANFTHSSSEIVNRPAPPFEAHEPGGKEWTLASIAGKPAALIFWNAACATCAAQIAEFAKAAAADMRLLAVNIGDNDAAVTAFAQKNHMDAAVLEGNHATAVAYHVDTYPSVAIIDAHGRLTQYQVGPAANPGQTVETAKRPRVATPAGLETTVGDRDRLLVWRPVPGAQSYVVEWETRDRTGWPSDRDGFLRVLPTRDTRVLVPCAQEGCSEEVRWRVFAVGSGVAGEATGWQTGTRLQ